MGVIGQKEIILVVGLLVGAIVCLVVIHLLANSGGKNYDINRKTKR